MDLYSTESKRIIALVQDRFNREEQELEATFGAKGVVDPTTFLQIAQRLRVKGFEVDATAQIKRGLQLRGSVAYAKGIYTDYPAGPCPLEVQSSSTAACNLTGLRLAGLPRWSTTIGGDYAVPITQSDSVFLHADTSFKSGYYGDPSLSKYTFINGYNVTNASIGYRSGHGWEVALFARNLFGANYIQNLTIQAGNSGLILGNPSDPRMIGVTVTLRQ
jgi:iron complex outermembrane receptor protein